MVISFTLSISCNQAASLDSWQKPQTRHLLQQIDTCVSKIACFDARVSLTIILGDHDEIVGSITTVSGRKRR